jgi:hypothetical protein
MVATQQHNNIIQMMDKLNQLYDKEEAVVKQIKILKVILIQIKEDKELLQEMIMHQSNKYERNKAL